jgi:hypothetical protein
MQYSVLSKINLDSNTAKLYDQAYQFWFQSWSEYYKILDPSFKPNPDDFFRQDFVVLIHENQKIAAIHLYSIFDLRSQKITLQSYLNYNFNDIFFAEMRRQKQKKIMTMESLFVDPEFRKSAIGFPIAHVLACLGQRIFRDLTDCDAIIAPARNDVKIAQIGYQIGFEALQKNIQLHGVSVDLIFCLRHRIKDHPDETVRNQVETFWRQVGTQTNFPRKIAS